MRVTEQLAEQKRRRPGNNPAVSSSAWCERQPRSNALDITTRWIWLVPS
ncbi:hypothetical protein APR11_001802 [Nocardia amikacinitolerans]|nr:hypothetical protein [Nocardia amikacinitolerans]